MAAGFDKAFLFLLRDGCEGGDCHVQFDTCGLTTVKGKWVPKPAYFFVATMRARLASLAWLGEQPSNDPNVMIYKLRDPKTQKGAYVVWSPTSKANVVKGYKLNVGATAATEVALVDQQLEGIETPLSPNIGAVTIDVTETPSIILVDNIQ